jgi:serine/threonine protein kinase
MKYEIIDNRYLPLIQKIRTYFTKATDSLYDARNQLKVLSYLDEDIVIKSFKIPHIINKVAYGFLRDSKAKKSYDNSLKIAEFVPKPIGYAEFTTFGLLYDSYFLCEKFEYDFTIREPLTQEEFKDKNVIFKALALFTYALHEKGVEHLDYSPGNILIKKVNDIYTFKIIDVNRMNFKTFTQNERLENFAKLWAKDEDLTVIIKAYAALIGMDEKEAVTIALKASQKHKDKKNLKKRLKGKKVVD